MMKRHRIGSAGAATLFSAISLHCAAEVRPVEPGPGRDPIPARAAPPAQPDRGPGSRDYAHAQVHKSLHGEGENAYWLFLPAEPAPREAPVVLFVHGTRAMNPYDYGGWIEHLVRRGNIVIYPVFEPASPWREAREGNLPQLERVIEATKAAISRLEGSGRPKPRLDRFAVTGHSFGGGLSAQVAARAKGSGLPEPRAVMPVQPGWKGREAMPLEALAGLPASTLLLVIEGDRDQFADTRQGEDIVAAASLVPDDHKAFIRMLSDEHGDPPLISDHSAPLSPRPDYGPAFSDKQKRRRGMAAALTGMREGETDALDHRGYWSLFDSLLETAWAGGTIDEVVGSGTDMGIGSWSDGTPVKRMLVKRRRPERPAPHRSE